MAGRASSRGSRLGPGLALLGVVAILGGTFGAGVFVGRYWARVQVTVGLVKPRAGAEAPATGTVPATTPERRHVPARTVTAPAAESAAAEKAPGLTFYQELTAPLERPGRGGGGDSTKATSAAPAAPPRTSSVPAPPAPARPDLPATLAAERAHRDEDHRRSADGFTVQVAAYGSRAPAEALRAALTARGFNAGVTSVDTPAGLRYRVRIGTFATREAAVAMVSRLASEARVGAIVMPMGARASAMTDRRSDGR